MEKYSLIIVSVVLDFYDSTKQLDDDTELAFEKKRVEQLNEVIVGVDEYKDDKVSLAKHLSP